MASHRPCKLSANDFWARKFSGGAGSSPFSGFGLARPKVVMRFWVLGGLFAVLGVAFALIFQS